jgi:hypothetical protein
VGFSFLYVGGFAATLAIVAVVEMVKVLQGGEVAPPHTWKWIVFLAAGWPFLVGHALLAWVTRPFIKLRAMPIHKKDYAFTITAHGEIWDCYHFTKEGKPGTMAFTKRQGKFIIGLMQAGRLTQEQTREALEKNCKQEDN